MVNIKNPFKSKIVPNAQNTHTSTTDDPLTPPPTVGSKIGSVASPRQSITIARPAEPEYKLSSVSPEGTFMPPSPPEKTSFLSRFKNNAPASTSRTNSTTKKEEDTGFLIPRESLDGYRRSFDIRPSMDGSGQYNDGRPSRSSLDLLSVTLNGTSPRRPSQNFMQALPTRAGDVSQSSKQENLMAPPLQKDAAPNNEDNEFEEVKLDDNNTSTTRKKHFWSRSSDLPFVSKKGQKEDENELRSIPVNSEVHQGSRVPSSPTKIGTTQQVDASRTVPLPSQAVASKVTTNENV